jgi:hypothetical protein
MKKLQPEAPMTPAITLSQAMSDPTLFGTTFGADSFWTWRTLARIVDKLPLSEREAAFYREATGRTKLPDRATSRRALRRFIVLVGRRGGKDRWFSAVAVWRCISTNWHEHITAGEGAVVILLGRDKRQASILRKYCEGLIAKSPRIRAMVTRQTDDTIEFSTGASLEISTNNSALIRGRSAIAILGSEVAHWTTDEASSNSDEEVLAAAEPSMSMCADGGLLFLGSSVHRKAGVMFRLFTELHGADGKQGICWFASSATMNPKLPPELIEQALLDNPARARAEYLNTWRDASSDFLSADLVDAVTDFGVYERPPQQGVRVHYFATCDAATGTGRDSLGLSIAHRSIDGILWLDVARERKPRFVLADVIHDFSHLLREYHISQISCDHFAFGIVADEWARNGIRCVEHANTTSENYLRLPGMFTARRVRLIDNATLRAQITSLECRVVSGHETVEHPKRASAHDDIAAAVAGALVLAHGREGHRMMPRDGNFMQQLDRVNPGAGGGLYRGGMQQQRQAPPSLYLGSPAARYGTPFAGWRR